MCKPAIKQMDVGRTNLRGRSALTAANATFDSAVMTASTVASTARAPLLWSQSAEAPFSIHRSAVAQPLVFASPHSGRLYPNDMMAASALDAETIRRSEDALVDELIEAATGHGATVIAASYARAYIDVNREPYELDASMFEDELPDFARGRSARVAAGLGSIARIVAEGQEIYARKLTFAEAAQRIETVHRPYHAALEGLLGEAKAGSGWRCWSTGIRCRRQPPARW